MLDDFSASDCDFRLASDNQYKEEEQTCRIGDKSRALVLADKAFKDEALLTRVLNSLDDEYGFAAVVQEKGNSPLPAKWASNSGVPFENVARPLDAEVSLLVAFPGSHHEADLFRLVRGDAAEIIRIDDDGTEQDSRHLVIEGEINDEFRTKPLEHGYSLKDVKRTYGGEWQNIAGGVRNHLLVQMSHAEGTKEGSSFLQGTCAAGVRKAQSMVRMYMMGFDCDSGDTIEEVAARAKALNTGTLIYTSHSNGKSETDIPKDTILSDLKIKGRLPTEEECKTWLLTKRGYKPSIVRELTVVGATRDGEGVSVIRVSHAPIEKFRIITFLKEPVDLDDIGSTREAREEWRQKYAGLAGQLGIWFDKSCTDPSRAFYFPRCPKGAENYKVHVVIGDDVDYEKLPKVDYKSRSQSEGEAAEERDDYKEVRRFLAKHSEGFLLATAIECLLPHLVLRPREAGGIYIRCPNDEAHSNPGDDEETGTFVTDAGEMGNVGDGPVLHCSHHACQGMDRLDRIVMLWRDNPEFGEAITNADYRVDLVEEENDSKSVAYFEAEIAKLAKDDLTGAKRVTNAIMRSSLDETERDYLLNKITKTTKVQKATLNKEVKKLKREMKVEKNANGETCFLNDTLYSERLDYAWRCLIDENSRRPRIFRGVEGMIRVNRNAYGTLVQETLDNSRLRHELNRVTRWEKSNNIGEKEAIPTPADIIQDMQGNPSPELPTLHCVVSMPVFTSKGKLLTTPGFDAESGLYYEPDAGFIVRPVPESPSAEDVDEAKKWILDDLLGDFPFQGRDQGKASCAHAVAFGTLPFMRRIIQGPTPVAFVDKPAPGTGASLFVDALAIVWTGGSGNAQPETKNDDELRKSLLAGLRDNPLYYWIDNINEAVNSGVLASVITSPRWQCRLLGRSDMIEVDVNCAWVFTGNNVRVSTEMVRRCYRIHLDAKMSSPETRTEFKHPDLRAFAKEHRSELVWAFLVLVQNWIAQKGWDGEKVLASFENWSRVMGGILEAAGIEGFLANRDELKEDADLGGNAERDFIQIWWDEHNEGEVNVFDGQKDAPDKPKADCLLGLIDNNAIALPLRSGDPKSRSIQIGQYLKKRKSVQYPVQEKMLSNEKIDVQIVSSVYRGRTSYALKRCIPVRT